MPPDLVLLRGREVRLRSPDFHCLGIGIDQPVEREPLLLVEAALGESILADAGRAQDLHHQERQGEHVPFRAAGRLKVEHQQVGNDPAVLGEVEVATRIGDTDRVGLSVVTTIVWERPTVVRCYGVAVHTEHTFV